MKILPLSSIGISANRQRQEFEPEALSDLCDDIALKGLFHPIVVRESSEGYILVAGERRFRAISDLASAGIPISYNNQELPLDHIPIVSLGELSPEEAEDAELSENIKRVDLTWQERASAEARLHELRSSQAQSRGEQQTYLATAEEILGRPLKGTTEQSYAQTEVRQAVVLAKHLHDPEIARAASAREAFKILQKKETERHYASLAATLGTTQKASRHTLLRGDALQLLGSLPSSSFDCILTDPPYGIDAQEFGTQVFHSHRFDDSEQTWLRLMEALATEAFRLSKPKAHSYIFCDPQRFFPLQLKFSAAGWRCFRTPLIWVKGTGMLPLPEHGPRRCYETILYAIKGDRPTTGVYNDVLAFSPEKTTPHPDQKPVDLYVDLLKRSVRPGETVLDPFAGSGTIFLAANKLQLTATGIELEETSFGIASSRLRELA